MSELPTGWKVGEVVHCEEAYNLPPASTDDSKVIFYGMRDCDEREGHRIYEIPKPTPLTEIVKIFKVGYHGADSYSFNHEKVNARVAVNAEKINEIIPCNVAFADSAGLKLKFNRQITQSEFKKIRALFPDENMIQDGMENYMDEWWDGSEEPNSIIENNIIHFWWN